MKITATRTINKKPNKRQQAYLDWTINLLIYIVALNLFAEYSSGIYIETFTISIFTALVLQASLKTVVSLEQKVSDYFSKKSGQIYKMLNILGIFSILFFSKFIILEIIDIIFREKVEIAGFVTLVLLIISMIGARLLLEYIYKKL